jgi:hypothetical protein
LDEERGKIHKKLMDVKQENGVMSREIERSRMFNKKNDEKKAKKENSDKLKGIIDD